jgi:uncharacterized cofD-like protein
MSISLETLPRRSQSNSEVVVLGGGPGLATVLRALRDEDIRLTAIVGIAEEGRRDGGARHAVTGAGVEDLRRSLEALTNEEGALLRAIRRPLTIEPAGRHPLGNLVLASVAAAFGDYGRASTWLGEQLGISGAVLPATKAPVQLEIETLPEGPAGAESDGAERTLPQVRFPGDVESPDASVAAIRHAKWTLLAPGALYRSVLSTAAVPDLVAALRGTPARVLWIANLAPDALEVPSMTANEHLRALRQHGVRVDAVMHDPSATLEFDAAELRRYGVQSLPHNLRSTGDPAVHDAGRLRRALIAQISSRSTTTVSG